VLLRPQRPHRRADRLRRNPRRRRPARQLENFRTLLKLADLAAHPRRHFVLQEVVHGPFRYPAGGDKSHQLLDLVAALAVQFPRQVHFLLGNHELSQWTNRRIEKADEDLNDLFRQGIETAYGKRADAVYAPTSSCSTPPAGPAQPQPCLPLAQPAVGEAPGGV